MTTLEDAETKLIEEGNQEAARTLETFESRWRYAVFYRDDCFFYFIRFWLLFNLWNASTDGKYLE